MVQVLLLALLLGLSALAQTPPSVSDDEDDIPQKRESHSAAKGVARGSQTQWHTCLARLKFPGKTTRIPLISGRRSGDDYGTAPGQNSWFMAQRAYPNGTVPDYGILDAMAQRRAMETRFRARTDADTQDASATWSPLGPTNVNSPEGSASGRVTAIAIDSRNPDTLYIGAAGGGVWRSTDGGATWQPLGGSLLSLVSGSLVLDERNNILYYGTGDFGAGTYGVGVLRSSDGGATWTNSSGWDAERNKPQFSGGTTARIVVNPADPRTIFAARSSGLWRSSDGGDSWNQIPANDVASDFVMDPSNPNRVFLALGRATGDALNGVYRSADGGNNWTWVNGLPAGTQVGRISLAMAPSNPLVLYASIARAPDYQLLAVFRSTDGGNIWTVLPAPATLFDSGGRGHGYWDNFVAVDPRDPRAVYLGGVELWKSNDGGMNWRSLSLVNGARVIHEDQFALAFKPGNPDTVYLGNDGGLFKSTDAGATWVSLNSGLPITQFNSVAVYPGNPNVVIGGTQDQGLVRFSGNSVWDQLFRGDAGAAAYDLTNPANIVSVKQFTRIMQSSNGGTFTTSGSGLEADANRVAFYAPLAISPVNGSNVYFGTYRVWASTNGGLTWVANSGDLTSGGVLNALAVNADGSRVYAGSSDGRVSVYFAGSWRFGTGLPDRSITSLVPDPHDPNTAYLTVSNFDTGHIYRTGDGGASWLDISGNLPNAPANAAAVDPRGPLYVAMDVGVFRSEDGGVFWSSFNAGLPNAFVTALALDAGTGTLTAATYGHSVYQVTLKPPQSGPSILAQSVVSSATSQPALAPGTLATLYGLRLAPAAAFGQGSPLPTNLGGTTVAVNGRPAPLIFVGPGQIDFQIPFEIGGAEAVVTVTTPEGSAAIPIQLFPTAPGIFPGSVVHSATNVPVDWNSPAAPGEVLTLLATGLAATNPPVASGVSSPSSPPAVTQAAVSAVLGSAPVTVSFAGLAPGLVGLYQVNLQVPDGASGISPLTISAGGRTSNVVMVVVRQ